ncbi:hypothetical protein HED49_17865 [Ochrobactrum daejeonense]|nr:hypothetical protein [Brucella daejeonensis]
MTLLVMSLLVTATGLDYLSAISSVAQAMANAGPGLGPVVGPQPILPPYRKRQNG